MQAMYEKHVKSLLSQLDTGDFFKKGLRLVFKVAAIAIVAYGLFSCVYGLIGSKGYFAYYKGATGAMIARSIITFLFTFIISLATFFGCAPALDPNRSKSDFWYKILGRQVTPKILFDFICNTISHTNGVANFAPYGLRKVEAGLLRDGFKRDEVVVAHPDHIEKFIGPATQVIGTYEMDPLGMGPVTMTFTYGRKQTSYDEYYNTELHHRIKAAKARTGSKAKVISGASGTWQYNYVPEINKSSVKFFAISFKLFYVNFKVTSLSEWIHIFKVAVNQIVEESSCMSINFRCNSS